MRYFGGKQRIAKPLSEFLNAQLVPGQVCIDLFCGSCNVISNIRQDVKRYANDKNKYLPVLFERIQQGLKLPKEVPEEMYYMVKDMPEDTLEQIATKGFIGFGCSFGGKWWGGYARGGEGRNYAENAYNSTMKKSAKMQDVSFFCMDYSDFVCPEDSLVYCDIPYKNTTQYSAVGNFDHEKFYSWMREQKQCRILVSEYKHNVPTDAVIVWEHNSKKDIRNKDGVQEATIEVLFEIKS